MKIIKLAKHVLPNKTYKCGICNQWLDIIAVTNNPKHFFNPGQHYSCPCGESQIWTNSVRKLDDLEKYCDGEILKGFSPEQYGFCNDKFCPKCWSGFSVIKNGQLRIDNKNVSQDDLFKLKEKGEDIQKLYDDDRLSSVDVHGCQKCQDNQNLIHQGWGSEGGTAVM